MKIGLSVPLSLASDEDADVRSVGQDVRNAAVLACEALGAPGDLIIADNEYSAEKAAQVIAQFNQERVAAVIGLPTSNEVKASAAALAQAGLTAITPMATSPDLARFKQIFRTRPGDLHAAKRLVRYLQTAGYKTIGTLSEISAYPLDCTAAIVRLGRDAGLSFVERTLSTHAKNWRLELQDLKKARIDALFISSQDEAGYFRSLCQAREIMGGIQVLGSAMPGSRKFRRMAGELAEGLIYISEPGLEHTLTPYGQDFLRSFTQRFGPPETGDYAVAFTFAAIFALCQAVKAGGDVAQRLSELRFDDPVNGAFRFEDNEITSRIAPDEGNNFACHRLVRIVGGQIEPWE